MFTYMLTKNKCEETIFKNIILKQSYAMDCVTEGQPIVFSATMEFLLQNPVPIDFALKLEMSCGHKN